MNMSTTAMRLLTLGFPGPVARETWAGQDGPKAVQATQARVAKAARTIIESSGAAHRDGGRPPGAVAAAVQRTGRPAPDAALDPDPVERIESVEL